MTTTVRIRETTRDQLREIEAVTGAGPTEALARAVDSFRRSLIFANADIAYAAVRADDAASAAYEGELAELEGTLADGLDDYAYDA